LKDQLFLLLPGFVDNDRREFCPECAYMWGILSYFPAIRDSLEIVPVGLKHPRVPITDRLGFGRFNSPSLILSDPNLCAPGNKTKQANGLSYLDSADEIAKYFSHRFGTPYPRGVA